MPNNRSFSQRAKRKLLGGNGAWTTADPVTLTVNSAVGSGNGLFVELSERKLGKDERGLVLTDWSTDNFAGDAFETPISHIGDLRAELMFYDKFDVPDQRVIGFSSLLADTLLGLGIGQRSIVHANGKDAEIMRRHSFEAYLALDKREQGLWAMGRSVRKLGVYAAELDADQGFRLIIADAFPVFHAEVELDAVLSFKKRRWDELLALRQSVDGLAKEVVRNGANSLENSPALALFEKSLRDHMAVMAESNYRKVKRSFAASFSWESLAVPATELLSTGNVTLLGAAGTGVTLIAKTMDGLRSKKSSSPFEYLTSANREFG